MHVDYDTFAAMSPLKRNNVLHQLEPENVAEIVTTHWQRFLDRNRARLNREQIEFIEENIAWIRPEFYRPGPHRQQVQEHDRQAAARLRELFSTDDSRRLHMGAFKNSGEIPNPIARSLLGRPRFDDSTGEALQAALNELAKQSPRDLRRDLPEILGRAFVGMPAGDNFWREVDGEDVRLAAFRAYGIVRSMRVRNPIALSLRLRKQKPLPERVEELQSALEDLATLSPAELRQRHPQLPEMLERAFDDVPSGDGFWNAVDDEDVRLAAQNMRIRIELEQAGELPPPGPRR